MINDGPLQERHRAALLAMNQPVTDAELEDFIALIQVKLTRHHFLSRFFDASDAASMCLGIMSYWADREGEVIDLCTVMSSDPSAAEVQKLYVIAKHALTEEAALWGLYNIRALQHGQEDLPKRLIWLALGKDGGKAHEQP